MRDGPIRKLIKAVARGLFWLSLKIQRRRMGPAPFELGGRCEGCGMCCEEPGISVGARVFHSPPARRAFIAWQARVNGFEYTRDDPESLSLLFRCTHFDWDTRRCDSYDSRPGICRDYPRALLQQSDPDLFEACGYRPIASNAASLLRVLDDQDLSEAQRRELKDRLHLE